MGQEIRGISQDPALTQTAPAGAAGDPEPAIGRYLARQRRLRGFSLEELADITKIPRRSLERLEEGAFDHQADGFARGFVRTVAAALGLDAEEAVMRLLGEPPGRDETLAASRTPPGRFVAAAALVAAAVAAAGFGLWRVGTGLAPRPRVAAEEIVTRHDAVRALARSEREVGAATEPLDSTRAGRPD